MPKGTKGSKGKPAAVAAKTKASAARAATAVKQAASKAAQKVKTAVAAAGKKGAAKSSRRAQADVSFADPRLFEPLSEGERADAVRTLLEDERLREMAKVGRYRVITVEPLALKPPDPVAGRRLARAVIYDYSSDRCVDVCVDLDRGAVCHVGFSTAQPMLSREEETNAVTIASEDQRVDEIVAAGSVAFGVTQYWSKRASDLAYRRRSAAVVFGRGGVASHVVVVDLTDGVVTDVVSAEQW